jgi:hypothetical protein
MIATVVWDPLFPIPVVVGFGCLLVAATVFGYLRIGAGIPRSRNLLLTGLRCAGIAGVLLLLLQPSRIETIPPPPVNRVTIIGVDSSNSMKQDDMPAGTRTEAAMESLRDAELIDASGNPAGNSLRFFKFAEDAEPATTFKPEGKSTLFHTSVQTMLGSLRAGESARAMLLFTDGHDFELVNPAKTGFVARQRQTPIYAVPMGKQGKVRDVSVRITGFQPYTYVKQKSRITAALRCIGIELETVRVELLRDGKVVQSRDVQTGDSSEVPVDFEVVEEKTGQYEYEVRTLAVRNETELENNAALTFLNVIDQQIQVLFLEGSPYWDTTFLQRSLLRNDKMNVDSVVKFTKEKARSIRKDPKLGPLTIPENPADWRRYDVVILGRGIEDILNPAQLRGLEAHVRDGGGAVIFARGPAFSGALAQNELEPVLWTPVPVPHVKLQIAREGSSLAPFRVVTNSPGGVDGQPELIAGRAASEKKPLTATLANSVGDGPVMPGFVHRRFGNGQVLSVGVDGLWRWAFNAKVDGPNTVFDRFWDQMILWMLASRDFLPTDKFGLRASTANVALGERISFRAIVRDESTTLKDVPLVIQRGKEEVARMSLTESEQSPDRLTVDFQPPAKGKYEATALFPGGIKQTVRFIVFDENAEETEVATDTTFLRKLCEASGGRLLEPAELPKFLAQLNDTTVDAQSTTAMVPLWDNAVVLWLIAGLFAADWYLRRKLGLA